jgi:hypothetical protein
MLDYTKHANLLIYVNLYFVTYRAYVVLSAALGSLTQ